jgi:hypothetical protein
MHLRLSSAVGGEMFDACLDALAPRGRLIIIGMMSQVRSVSAWHPGHPYPR